MSIRLSIAPKQALDINKSKLAAYKNTIDLIKTFNSFSIDLKLNSEEEKNIEKLFLNSQIEELKVDENITDYEFDYLIEISFLPGVTDNQAKTAKKSINQYLKRNCDGEVFSSKIYLIKTPIQKEEILESFSSLYNPLIEKINILSKPELSPENFKNLAYVKLNSEKTSFSEVDINLSDEDLITLGKFGIANEDGSRRGPLALDLDYMKVIKDYFLNTEKRNPTDIELEAIAQTWSEHCKHTIFADPIDEVKDGLYKAYIKNATNEIRKTKAAKDFCFSVFSDNAGIIEFNDEYNICHKVETHNSPSALDPFGGAITGIVGVNRDAIGCGLGAKPVANTFGFCFADPEDKDPLYRDKDLKQKMLSPRRIMEGVIEGVNVGGNCSGIPTVEGFTYFDSGFKGKPLVFVGTLGLIPKTIKSENSELKTEEKSAKPGDYIVVLGGRTGLDGIHGATFSSVEMDESSPATAVQIGDPITQKKLSDAIVKEARDLNLYNSITDCGAGGISCSIAEMARESNGCRVNLNKVPLKYTGLSAWQVWISESQERMTLSVAPEKWSQLNEIMQKHDVEATVVGEFTNSGRCLVYHDENEVLNLDLQFLHNGLPKRDLVSKKPKDLNIESTESLSEYGKLKKGNDLSTNFKKLISSLNISSHEYINEQYDYEVQSNSVIKPLQGINKVNGEFAIVRPDLKSNKAVALSHALYPSYSDYDSYRMAAASIDSAIRNLIATGVSIENIALLDNFCWCSANKPERLYQLKEAARACYDYAVGYGTPYISGKDSMFNDFKGYNSAAEAVKISIDPTLLISSVGVLENALDAISIDFKAKDDLIYVLGSTESTLAEVNAKANKKIYELYHQAVKENLINSAIAVTKGGLAASVYKMSLAGDLGAEINLNNLKTNLSDDETKLFSESQGRIVFTVKPEFKEQLEAVFSNDELSCIGKVSSEKNLKIDSNNTKLLNIEVKDTEYKKFSKGFYNG
ncbi:MAG: phosphoribosylformylglycinamidine synthase [Candidatus Caenarcaniphilales bacterium]|nr:phosphoribosylformylglycinamidine synthase [Candidatus Caenarcaniphilales bacterium]